MGKSTSPSPEVQRREKKEKKHKKEKKRHESKERQQSSQFLRSPSQKQKKEKKDKKEKKEKKHKEKQRSREKSIERSRSREKQESKREDPQKDFRPRSPRSTSPQSKGKEFDEERARKIAMRKVKARLLRFGELEDSDGDNQEVKKPPLPQMPAIPKPPPKPLQGGPVPGKKRQSKWGKTSSSQPSLLPAADSAQPEKLLPKDNLELKPAGGQLQLSEDKSIDYFQDDHHEAPSQQLQEIEEEYVDPLDQFMEEIQGEAAPQMDLAMKPKANIISYDEIVTNDFSSSTVPQVQPLQEDDNEDVEEQMRRKFLAAINNLEETKKTNKEDKRGVLMEHNEENKEDLQDFEQEKVPELDFFAKQRKMAERKELGQVDHSKIEYNQVRFNLYREAEQVKNYNPKEVQKYRKEAGDIKVRGKEVLNPVFNWYHCGYSDKVLNLIQKRQYKKPFPIQAQAMPLLLSGRDVIGIAETGSGKTLAYLLPAIRHIQDQKRVQEGEGPISIIMTPTRQLARQVYLEAKAFCRPLNIRVIAVYGGQSVQNQISDFKEGAELVVCTPGRMIDILTLNKGKVTNLKRVTFIVLDEADRMFDLGFEPQITRILDNVRPLKQVALFSATFPRNVEALARKILNKPVEVIVGARGQACHNVEQVIEVREQTSKLLRLLEILGLWNDKGSILIFVDKQTEADYLFQQLLKYGYNSLVLHGAMDPDDRQFTIYDFKKGVLNIMIATSVCARGLDIPSIVLVINFKCPNHLEDYIHRIGRTGRGGNRGTAITFITPQQEQYSVDLLKALEMAEINPPEELIKLSQTFMSKVKKGQARKIRNRNIQGTGFKFDEDEEEKTDQIKEMIKKQMKSQGLGFDDSDDEDIQMKKKKEEDMRGRNSQERIAEAIKNPEIKSKLLTEAVKAVSQAIKNGSAITTEKLLDIAVGSMKEAVTKYKVVKTAEDGVEQVTKLVNQFVNSKTTAEGPDFFSYDFEINDYPLGAREKACNRGFLHGIQNQTNCQISLRGVYVEPGKKAPIGCRKLYLHIQGENKYYVTEAYKQIKQVLEESAYESMHMGLAPGKYSL